jgi:predicted glycogen debranching enzyme
MVMLSPVPVEGTASELPTLRIARQNLLDYAEALQYEWLVTNGIGGYAFGTVPGVDTRRFHGLLIAPADSSGARMLLLARLHDAITWRDDVYPLHTAEYHDGTVHPVGHVFLEEFFLDGQTPVWRYHCREVEIEKTLWLEHGRNTVFIRYAILNAPGPVQLRLEPFVAYREDSVLHVDEPARPFAVEARSTSCRVDAFPGAAPLWLRLPAGCFVQTGLWYRRFLHRRERERGLADLEDLYTPGIFTIDLESGDSATFVATVYPEDLLLDPAASQAGERRRQVGLLHQAQASPEDVIGQQLILAADQFLELTGPDHRAVAAEYPWFTDRSDVMVALPGLCLASTHMANGRAVLTTLARHLEQGHRHLADRAGAPEFSLIETTLWLFEAMARYERAHRDHSLVDELLPTLDALVAAYNRRVREATTLVERDGLLRVEEDGRAIGPRQGKPVEIQALWYNALRLLAHWRRQGSKARRELPEVELAEVANACRVSFHARFWSYAGGYCYDLVDGPNGDDREPRPNQLLTASLSCPLLDASRWASMLRMVERWLLMPPAAPRKPSTGLWDDDSSEGAGGRGDGRHRSRFVSPWLIGPYADVVRRVRGESWDVRPILNRLVREAGGASVGPEGAASSPSLGEIGPAAR